MNIIDMKTGNSYSETLLVKSALEKVAKNGSTYVTFILSDKTGDLHGNMFNTDLNSINIKVGDIATAKFYLQDYNGSKIANISYVYKEDPSNVDISNLIKCYPDAEVAFNCIIEKVLTSFLDKDLKEICEIILKEYREDILSCPGAKTFHHSYKGGLIEHIYSMLRASFYMKKLYPEINLDLLQTGIILHDVMKIKEYSVTDFGVVDDYSKEGKLIGHITMVSLLIGDVILRINDERKLKNEELISLEKKLLVQHMVLSHHGKKEFGSPVQPSIKEAMLLSEIDMIDSRMSMFRMAEEGIESGEFSDYVPSLGTSVYKA